MHLLIHSGSRSLGASILNKFLDEHKESEQKGAVENSEEFLKYMDGHNLALNFA